ncbi:MAG: long-chain fatty acid--CoA ligase [Chthoniobacterales bacterium]|nr:long-chain fatty acid--CoA ligase [Chthoniobacterales bacterium]
MPSRLLPKTLAELFFQAGDCWGDRPAFCSRVRVSASDVAKEEFRAVTYRAWRDRALSLAAALVELGLEAREHVGLLSDNCFEWILADAAIQFCGAADVPRAADTGAAEAVAILNHADVRFLFVEHRALLKKIEPLRHELPQLQKIILMREDEGLLPEGVFSMKALEAHGERLRSAGDRSVEKRIAEVQPEDLFTIIYTSGTTGPAKGVQLTHRAICSQIKVIPFLFATSPTFAIRDGDLLQYTRPQNDLSNRLCVTHTPHDFKNHFETKSLQNIIHSNSESRARGKEKALSLLPIWHSYERVFEMLLISQGAALYYTSIRYLARDLLSVKPTVMASAPRVWEALYEKIMMQVASQNFFQKKLFAAACTAAQAFRSANQFFKKQKLDLIGESWEGPLKGFLWCLGQWSISFFPFLVLDFLVLRRVRQSIGGAFRATISGGGALPPHIDLFFHNIGIRIFEGYGLTESAPVLAVRTVRNFVLGTVGPPLPETEIKIVDLVTGALLYPDFSRADGGRGRRGEICARGPQLMKGYYKDPEGTARVLRDGWLHTGDIGLMTFNDCLKIVGRCKETIVLLNGENVEPLPLESKLLESPLIEQCMVVGQDQKHLGVLLVPSLKGFAEHGIVTTSLSALLKRSEEVLPILQTEIRNLVSAAHGFKSFERIKCWRLLAQPFEVGHELTPTYKLKRHVIAERYRALMEEMFRAY